jgi:isoquinoline 1-oxidoreductase subunit beta
VNARVLPRTSRREFLKGAGTAAVTVLTVGFEWSGMATGVPGVRAAALAMQPTFMPNAFLRIGADESVTVIAKHVEMGQGAYTGIATIVAEELDADWTQVRVESAPADVRRYANLVFGMQGTGGSSAMANSWAQLREAGAKARALLIAAAAKRWQVPASSLTAENGVVYDAARKRRATFGSLVGTAAALPVPDAVTLKEPKDHKLIGHRIPRVDVPPKCDGSAQFTIDVEMPGMLVALLKRPPLFGATVAWFDPSAAAAVPGVVKVVQTPNKGIAVIARSFWAAKKGRDALEVKWDESRAEKRSSTEIMAEYRKRADQPGLSARKEGDAAAAMEKAVHKISAAFEFPYLAHAPMEPLDAVVKLTAESCEIWAGDQFQTVDQANAAKAAGLDPQRVSIHTLYAGGSFGRRANTISDYIVEAVSVAKAYGADGTPIKLQWTREDDIQGGLYRPMYYHKLEAGLDARGGLLSWRHAIVGQSIMAGTSFSALIKNGIDSTSVEGAANIPYAIPNIDVELTTTQTGVPVLWWRVVGSSHTTFAVESFIDEAAHAAGQDPYTYRRDLLAHEPRMRAVLDLAAEKSGWSGSPLPKGQGRGIAVAEAFNTFVAQVAEVTVSDAGEITVDRVVCALDCGTPINPDIITAQMEGGIGFGLGAALYGAITLKDGRVEQDNFNGYRVLRMNEMPRVEVYIVPSNAAPTGVGEPGVAPLGPAVANAVFAATGKRTYAFPFERSA